MPSTRSKIFCGFKYRGLFYSAGFVYVAIVVEFGEDWAHAVVAQAASVVTAGDELTSEGVHFSQRSDTASVAEIVIEIYHGLGLGGRQVRRL